MLSSLSPTRLPRRILPLLCLALATFAVAASTAKAQSIGSSENPWLRVAIHDSDEDHAHHVMAPSPFDTMSGWQLAAVPKANRVHYNAPSKCVPAKLKAVLQNVAAKFGPVTVSSTVRSKGRNRKVGGRKGSYHLKCAAVDFRVHGRTKGLLSYLAGQKAVGGYKRYKTGFYHIDSGPRRTW
jgi:uncharacterized protein YcbK (DUF882 family)